LLEFLQLSLGELGELVGVEDALDLEVEVLDDLHQVEHEDGEQGELAVDQAAAFLEDQLPEDVLVPDLLLEDDLNHLPPLGEYQIQRLPQPHLLLEGQVVHHNPLVVVQKVPPLLLTTILLAIIITPPSNLTIPQLPQLELPQPPAILSIRQHLHDHHRQEVRPGDRLEEDVLGCVQDQEIKQAQHLLLEDDGLVLLARWVGDGERGVADRRRPGFLLLVGRVRVGVRLAVQVLCYLVESFGVLGE